MVNQVYFISNGKKHISSTIRTHIRNPYAFEELEITKLFYTSNMLLKVVATVKIAGFYYIDPNQGSPADALLAYCNFSESRAETCLHPRSAQVTASDC